MQKNKVEIIFTIIGLTIVGTMFYFYYKKNKSFLKMTDSEKNKFLQEEYNKRKKIINDPNLTAEEKAKEHISTILVKFALMKVVIEVSCVSSSNH